MKKKFTQFAKSYLTLAISLIALLFTTSSVSAQIGCPNQRIIGTETFGQGTTSTSDPYVTSGLTYQAAGDLTNEGVYRVINNTHQKPEWHTSTDHTGDVNGKMLVINGQHEIFYQRTVLQTAGYIPGNYIVSMYIMNIDTLGVCGPDALLPIITINVEYLSQSNTWVPLGGSPYISPAVPQTVAATWVNLGSTFTLPATGSYFPPQLRVTFGDGTVGGCGNDFALDDLQLSFCPEAGPMPVEFLDFSAQAKGSGVSLNWSTAQEINNSYFEVQRSADGATNWAGVATVNGAGNSQVVKNYNAYDASPLPGVNYYRIKQVDIDGKYKFSKTVSLKTNFDKTNVSVLENPFYSNLTVNFASATSQMVSARLIDITGKQIAAEKWSVSAGNSRKNFSNMSVLLPGMYILSIRNSTGEILYNGKIVKQ